MAFRKKHEEILEYDPDLLVLQECENGNKLEGALASIKYNQVIWYGNNPHKGVAIISFNDTQIKLREYFKPEFEYVIPVEAIINGRQIEVYCIWAMPHKTDRKKRYIGQIWGAINYYSQYLNQPSILIGDFNSNSIWDTKIRDGNHSDVVEFLKAKNILSIYHTKNKINHGEEKDPTIFLLKNIKKPYHLDYCFVSESLISNNTSISVGKYDDWIKLSDHMPIIIDRLALH